MTQRLAVAALFFAGFAASAADLPRKAPDFAVQTGPDKYIWLSAYAGKPVVLGLVLTTCPHCQFTTGLLTKIAKDYEPKGIAFIETAVDPMSSLRIPDFVKQLGVTFPVGYNEQSYAAKFMGVGPNDPMMMPQLIFIDKAGMIRVILPGDDPGMERGIQEKTIRDTIDKVIREGQTEGRPPARKKMQ
jgi:thiol-disulfide isomerase/thioredoxin